jgi:predicted AAA+ superfamily ATPase
MLPPAERLIGAQLDRYISDKLYWVLHAPRQTGKTTFLLDWKSNLKKLTWNVEQTAQGDVTIVGC